jgi:hypothetical protein
MNRMLNFTVDGSDPDRFGNYIQFRGEALALAKSVPGCVIIAGSNRWSDVHEFAGVVGRMPEASLMIAHSDGASITDTLMLLARIRAQFRLLETSLVHDAGGETQELYAKMTAMFTVTRSFDITSIRQSGSDASPRGVPRWWICR